VSYHLPERKAEQAFKAYFGAITGVAIRTRFSGAVKDLPELNIVCANCDPAIRNENQSVAEWACDLTFTIRSRYIKQDMAEGDAHDTVVGAVSDMIADSTIADLVNYPTSGLNAFKTLLDFQAVLWKPGARRNRVEEKDYVTELTGTLWLVPSAT
jgi:hypothetical protein